jgi:hypothetical protein
MMIIFLMHECAQYAPEKMYHVQARNECHAMPHRSRNRNAERDLNGAG